MGRTGWVLCALLIGGCQTVFGVKEVGKGGDGGTAGGITFDKAYANQVATGGTTVQVHFDTPPAEHDLVVVFVATWHNAPALVADSSTMNQYTEVPASAVSAGGSNLHMFYAYDIHTMTPFNLTVATTAAPPPNVGEDELTVIAHHYSGAQLTDGRDGQNAANGDGSPNPVVSADCGNLAVPEHELVVAGMTRDFNGAASVPSPWKLESSVDLSHQQYMVLATADQIVGPGNANPTFSLQHNGDGFTWACLTAAFR